MDDRQPHHQFHTIIGKWRDLAEKRRLSFVELQRNGRWKLYYTEAQFILRMGQVSELSQIWAKLAAPAPRDRAPPAATVVERATTQSPRRNAA